MSSVWVTASFRIDGIKDGLEDDAVAVITQDMADAEDGGEYWFADPELDVKFGGAVHILLDDDQPGHVRFCWPE